ncbi:hypothetical protein ABQF35_24780 [Mycobacterium syngnathidarum]
MSGSLLKVSVLRHEFFDLVFERNLAGRAKVSRCLLALSYAIQEQVLEVGMPMRQSRSRHIRFSAKCIDYETVIDSHNPRLLSDKEAVHGVNDLLTLDIDFVRDRRDGVSTERHSEARPVFLRSAAPRPDWAICSS